MITQHARTPRQESLDWLDDTYGDFWAYQTSAMEARRPQRYERPRASSPWDYITGFLDMAKLGDYPRF